MSLLFLLLVGFAFWLLSFAYHHASKSRFELYAQELAARGESLEVEEVRPAHVVNPEDNVAAAPVFEKYLARCRADPEANAEFDPVWGGLNLKSIPGFSVNQASATTKHVRYITYPLLSAGFDLPDDYIVARAILDQSDAHAATLDEIKEALARPQADFGTIYGDFTVPMPELNGFIDICKFLHRHGRAALITGRNDLARSSAVAILRFSRHVGSQATMIHVLVGASIHDMAISLIHEGLGAGVWREEDLKFLAVELEARWLESTYLRALRMERIGAVGMYKKQMEDPKYLDDPNVNWLRVVKLVPDLRKGWCYDNMEFYCRTTQETMLEDGKGSLTTQLSNPFPAISSTSSSSGGLRDQLRDGVETFRHGLARSSFLMFNGVRERVVRSQVRQDHARIAVALALYQIVHGDFPETLDSITLSGDRVIPVDPYTGLGYVYRPLGGTDYQLYSPGPDGRDDGGLIRHRLEKGDWVWRLHLPEDFDFDAYRR